MGVTNLQVYNTVYNITKSNNTLIVRLNDEQLEELGVDTKLVEKIQNLYETADKINAETVNKYAENIQTLLNESYDKQILQKDYEEIKSIVDSVKLYPNPPEIKIPSFKIIAYIHFQIYLTPGIYEIKEINECIQELIKKELISLSTPVKFTVEADTVTMRSIIKSSNPFYFNSDLNLLLGFTEKNYSSGTHKSEKPVMITSVDKVHLKCDCIDGSIVNGRREQILFSFDLDSIPGYKIRKEPTTILYKKINKNRLDYITFYLEDSNHQPVDFNGETLTFTIQIIKI